MSQQILEGARSYRVGIKLSALFKNGSIIKEVFYLNPKDIPLKIPHFGIWLYLYSICPAEKRQHPKPKEENRVPSLLMNIPEEPEH